MTSSLRPSSIVFLTVETTVPMTRASCIKFHSKRFDGDQRQVVVLMRAGGELFDVVDKRVNDCRRAQVAMFEQEVEDAGFTELLTMRLRRVRFRQPVGVKEEHVAFFQVQRLAFVLLFVEDSEQQPAGLQRPPFARSANQQWRIVPGG